MPVLHMETERVRSTGQALGNAAANLSQELQSLNQSVQALASAWLSNSSDAFMAEISPLLQRLNRLIQEGEILNVRLQREVDEWEAVDSGWSGTNTAHRLGVLIGLSTGTIIQESLVTSSTYISPYDVDKPDFRLDTQGLMNFQPAYAGPDSGHLMQKLNAFMAANYKDGVCRENPELLQELANTLGISYREAQHQLNQLTQLMQDSGQSNVSGLNLAFADHWGSRRQLMFGKIVGDSLGLHPAFAAMLNPSGGLIGPGDELEVLILDGNLSGVIDENVWDYHGAAHDAAGYLRNHHNVGPGYEYVTGGIYTTLNNLDGYDPNHSLSGQASGYVYWCNQLDISYKNFVDAYIKMNLGLVGSMAL